MQIITNNQQKELDTMQIKKLKFVAKNAFIQGLTAQKENLNQTELSDLLELEVKKAEQVAYTDNVIFI